MESAPNNPPVSEAICSKKRIPVVEHPMYSPAPCNFYALNGTHFHSMKEVKAKTAEFLRRVTSDEKEHYFE